MARTWASVAADLLEVEPEPTWRDIARPEQVAPDDSLAWTIWLILAGRGFGKTRSGAEWVAEKMRLHPGCRVALVAATFADGRDTMVEGESGLLAVLKPEELPKGSVDKAWNRSMGELFLANGSRAKVFSSEKPKRLRGPQHHFAWGDEAAAWDDADQYGIEGTVTTWDNLMLGLRLGLNPQVCVTTTPAPVALLKGRRIDRDGTATEVEGLPALAECHVTRGRTYDNLDNLAPPFRKQILSRYEGTRLGLQELEGELLTDVPGALWKLHWLRRAEPPATFERTVVSIDPAVTKTEASDETGIIGAAVDVHTTDDGATVRRGWVLADRSGHYSPDGWAAAACSLARELGAEIIVEDNQGGDMVVTTLRAHDPTVRIRRIHATVSKEARAQPVAALYEQQAKPGKPTRVLHSTTAPLSVLEDQMTTWVPGEGKSPDRVDAVVHALRDLLIPSTSGYTSHASKLLG